MDWCCSRCGKELKDYIVKVTTSFEIFKVTDNGVFVPFNNVSDPTSEYLCADCFDEYSKCIDRLNHINGGLYTQDVTKIVDDIQYGFNNTCSQVNIEEDVKYD